MSMQNILARGLSVLLVTGIVACDDDDDVMNPPTPTSFTVTIENRSTPNTVNTTVLGGVVPLSPGVWAVYDGSNPAFTAGAAADVGTERIAEDGFTTEEETALVAANVSSSGTFSAAGGMGPPIEPGETATFTISAVPGDMLTFETMFVQSNDYFYSFGDAGLALFDAAGDPISGDVTGSVRLWDAGTEVDTALGDPTQKPQQDPSATDVGMDEGETVRLVSQTTPVFTIPAVTSVIRVTIMPN